MYYEVSPVHVHVQIDSFVLIRYGKTHRHRNDCHERSIFYSQALKIGSTVCHTKLYGEGPRPVSWQK